MNKVTSIDDNLRRNAKIPMAFTAKAGYTILG